MVFSAAGNLDHDAFVDQVAKHFSSLDPTTADLTPRKAPGAHPHITLKRKKSLEQVQLCLGVPAPPVSDADRYSVYLLNTMLGGAHVLTPSSSPSAKNRASPTPSTSEMNPSCDAGSLLRLRRQTSVDKTEKVLQLTLLELRQVSKKSSSQPPNQNAPRTSLPRATLRRSHWKAQASRMANLARQQMYFGRFFDVEEITTEIEAVTPETIQRLARELFQPERMALTLLGNLGPMKITRENLGLVSQSGRARASEPVLRSEAERRP